jgi:hypothetical protein
MRAARVILPFMLASFFSGCSSAETALGPVEPTAASVTIAPTSVTLAAGQSGAFDSHVYDAKGAVLQGYLTTWTSSNPSVLAVTDAGTMTAGAPGVATVRVTAGAHFAESKVTVIPAPQITLLVANSTCSAGRCDSVRVRMFPESTLHTPAGPWSLDLGLVTGSEACLTIKPFATFYVHAGSSVSMDLWNGTRAMSLGGFEPSLAWNFAIASTPDIVPNSAQGWRVSLPGSGAPVPAEACSPS